MQWQGLVGLRANPLPLPQGHPRPLELSEVLLPAAPPRLAGCVSRC